MKKTNNKGFSLVELIIVIAIMAILAGAIAPALIRYIDKSRRSNDVSACKTIKTAVETAMGNEKAYEYLTSGAADTDGFTSTITINTNQSTAAAGVSIVAGTGATIDNATPVAADQTMIAEEIFKNIGESTPKLKYKKAADGTNKPDTFFVMCTAGGSVNVYLGTAANTKMYKICPEICDDYQ